MGKKHLFLMALLLMCGLLPASAQRSYRSAAHRTRSYRTEAHRWGFMPDQYMGFRLGYDASTLTLHGCTGVDGNFLSGMNIGMVYGVALTYDAPVYFETGLLYTGKGARLNKGTERYSIRMHDLEVPLVFKYVIPTADPAFTVQPFAGAFASVGIGGRYKDFQNREKHMTFHKGSFQNWDAGFRIGCGLGFDVFYAEVSYDFGLANMASSNAYNLKDHLNYDDFDDKIRTGNLELTVGINF